MSIPPPSSSQPSDFPASTLDKARTHSGSSGPRPWPAASPVPTGASEIPKEHDEHLQGEVQHDIAVDEEHQDVPFQPFFTLVEDGSTQTTIHPSVTYVFADDEHDPVTDAAIRIKQNQTRSLDQQQRRGSQQQGVTVTDPSGRRKSTQGSPDEPIERCLLVTLGADGRSIQSAQSLSADWHVDDAELTPAPTLDSDGSGSAIGTSPGTMNSKLRRGSATVSDRLRIDEERERLKAPQGDGPLMLRLHGHGLTRELSGEEALKLGLNGLRDMYLDQMDELRQVIAAGQSDGVATEEAPAGQSQLDETG